MHSTELPMANVSYECNIVRKCCLQKNWFEWFYGFAIEIQERREFKYNIYIKSHMFIPAVDSHREDHYIGMSTM